MATEHASDDIDKRIHNPHFVKVNLLHIDSVGTAFCLSQPIEDRPTPFLDRLRQPAAGKDLSDTREGQRPLKPLLNDHVDLYRRERATMHLTLSQLVTVEL